MDKRMEIVANSNVSFMTIEFTIYGFYSKSEGVYQMMGIRINAANNDYHFRGMKINTFFMVHFLFNSNSELNWRN